MVPQVTRVVFRLGHYSPRRIHTFTSKVALGQDKLNNEHEKILLFYGGDCGSSLSCTDRSDCSR